MLATGTGTGRIYRDGILGWMLLTGLFVYLLMNFLPISSKTINNVFYVGCALPSVILAARHRAKLLAWFKEGFSLWLFLLLLAAFALLDGDVGAAKASGYIGLLGLAMFSLHRWDAEAERWLFGWLAAIAVIALGGATHLWTDWFQQYAVPLRVSLWNKMNPNETALMMAAGLVWLWEFCLESRLKRSGGVVYWLAAVVFCLLIAWVAVLFQSRSSLLGFGAYLSLKLVMNERRWYFLGAVMVIIGMAWLQDWHWALGERGFSYRSDIWSDAWQRLTQACGMLTGCGNDNHLFFGQFAHAHSAYLMLLYQYGLVVFLPFLVFALLFFTRGLRCHSSWMLVAAVGWGGVLATGTVVVHSPQPHWIYFWIPTFLAMLECRKLFQAGSKGLMPNGDQ